MRKIFGVDIQKEIAAATKGELFPLTLTKLTKGVATSGSLTAGTNDVPVIHVGEGFDEGTSKKDPRSLIEGATAIVTIIGGSLPEGIAPVANDRVAIGGLDYEILKVDSDPALAVYECQVSA